jgi:hypothetical protein
MKMYLSTGTTIVEPPVLVKPGMSSSPTDLVGLSLLTAFSVSRSLVVTNDKKSEQRTGMELSGGEM